MSVGIVVVSHSPALAQAAVDFALQMVPEKKINVAVAAGTDDGSFGTDAMAIMSAIESVNTGAGVVVFTDLGSAVLSTDVALEFLGQPDDVVMADAPFVEGLLAAMVSANGGKGLAEVLKQARGAYQAKATQIQQYGAGSEAEESVERNVADTSGGVEGVVRTVMIANPMGLHARPAAQVADLAGKFAADVTIAFDGGTADAASLLDIAALGVRGQDEVELSATGSDAEQAVEAIAELIATGFGES
ncbi:PTS-dependent dihydroxyacetone kinase phosphotransferase subunit DhaM [Arcanobacterium phocisimile]|uniref:Phosphocarrier protein HPr n=1 Tax=Arcanobacterium phocisimile TaxID=1302235 RepID=A0ABX7IEN1_9ACTO|nr:dihydroxyacetone kinase phosphoryl donor subunit DhaM [Arcanobacterium phocisimile]QRV01601.1 PTS-dependent dihydroxyacetone kinase phosphotransferase subunit DhaM [Arcanobacterium phocisimile]